MLASARPNNRHLTAELNWFPQRSLGNPHLFFCPLWYKSASQRPDDKLNERSNYVGTIFYVRSSFSSGMASTTALSLLGEVLLTCLFMPLVCSIMSHIFMGNWRTVSQGQKHSLFEWKQHQFPQCLHPISHLFCGRSLVEETGLFVGLVCFHLHNNVVVHLSSGPAERAEGEKKHVRKGNAWYWDIRYYHYDRQVNWTCDGLRRDRKFVVLPCLVNIHYVKEDMWLQSNPLPHHFLPL